MNFIPYKCLVADFPIGMKHLTWVIFLLAALAGHLTLAKPMSYSRPSLASRSHCCDRDREAILINQTKSNLRSQLENITSLHRSLLMDNLHRLTDLFHSMIATARTRTDSVLEGYPELTAARGSWTNHLFESFSLYIFGQASDSDSDHHELSSPMDIVERSLRTFFDSVVDAIYAEEKSISTSGHSGHESVKAARCIFKLKQSNPNHFGTAPAVMIGQLRKSLQVSRTIVQSLQLALSVFNHTANASLSENCVGALVQMTSCPLCMGRKDFEYCTGYCSNVARGCFAHFYVLEDPWDQFLYELEQLSDGLLKDYNLESVLTRISEKIDTAISTALDNKQRFRQECSTPYRHARQVGLNLNPSSLATSKSSSSEIQAASLQSETSAPPRKASPKSGLVSSLQVISKSSSSHPSSYSSSSLRLSSFGPAVKFSSASNRLYTKVRRHSASPASLFVFMGDLVHHLKDSKKFFQNFPDQICTGKASSEKCWNGETFEGYTKTVVNWTVAGQQNNPEVEVGEMPTKLYILITKLGAIIETIQTSIRTIPESDPNKRATPNDDEDYSNLPEGSGDGFQEDRDEEGHEEEGEGQDESFAAMDEEEEEEEDRDEEEEEEVEGYKSESEGDGSSHQAPKPGSSDSGTATGIAGDLRPHDKGKKSCVSGRNPDQLLLSVLLLIIWIARGCN